MGHRSNGPAGLVSHGGVWCILPNAPVAYPFIPRTWASVAQSAGRTPVYPRAEVATSAITPMLALWWLRPVSSACRVGEHSAVVWNRVNVTPSAAKRSAAGISRGPPKALDAPKPMSSTRTIRTFGAPSGGRSGGSGAGALASRASTGVSVGASGTVIGSRCRFSSTLATLPRETYVNRTLDPAAREAHHPSAGCRARNQGVLVVANLPFSVLAKPTGAACNLDCTYCFFLSKEQLYDAAEQRMSEELLVTHLTNLFASQPDGYVEVAWQGGEPTMRGLDFHRRAVALAEELRRPGQQVQHVMQTNGTLIDDRWAAFLAEHRFLVGVSIDGPAELHDAYRVNRAGQGSHAQVVRGWRRLQEHGVDVNVLCTVHAANQDHPVEVYRYLRDELGARHLQLIPIVERVPAAQLPIAEHGWRQEGGPRLLYRQTGSAVTSRSVDPAAWGRFLTAVFDEWVARDVGEVFVQHVEATLGNLFGQPSLCVHAPECGAALVVDHAGDVYSCDHYVEPGYRIGNVAADSYQDMLTSPRQQAFGQVKRSTLPARCRSCPVLWACHGGCPKDRLVPTEDGGRLNYLCDGYLPFFSHADPWIRTMAALLVAGRDAAEVMTAPPAGTPDVDAAGRLRPT